MPRKTRSSQPAADEPDEVSTTALEALQGRMQEFERVWRNDDCASRGFTGCNGRCAFVYSSWTCVPKHLYDEAKTDSLRMIMYIVMHSPRMGGALERLAASLDSIAARETKDELHAYAKRMFGKKAWGEFLKGDVKGMADAIVRKSKGSLRRGLELAVFVAVASVVIVGMSTLIVPSLAIMLGWLIMQLSAILSYITTFFGTSFYSTVFSAAPWVGILIASFVSVMTLLEMFSPNISLPLRDLREDIGSWFDKFTVALSRAGRDEVETVKAHGSVLDFGKRGMSYIWSVVRGPLASAVGLLWGTVKEEEEEAEEEYDEDADDDYEEAEDDDDYEEDD